MARLNLAYILKFNKVFKGMFGLGEKEERKLLGVGFFLLFGCTENGWISISLIGKVQSGPQVQIAQLMRE